MGTPVRSICFFAATLSLAFCSTLLADGFRNPPEGARAVGAFGGHRAFADDANAVIHNAANMVDLERPMIQFNTTLGYGENEFQSTSGFGDETDAPWFAIPGLSIVAPLADGKYALGLATYVPYGRSVEWGNADYFSSFQAVIDHGALVPYSGTMKVVDITPNIAFRLNEALSLAAGADIYYGQVEQETKLYGVVGIPNGTRSTLIADGTSFGWNAALSWKITEKQRLAATYRAPFTIKYTGDNELSIGTKSSANAKIEYPTVIGLAYGYEFTDTLRAEVDGEWLDFSQYANLIVNDTAFGTQTSPQALKDTWTAGIGIEWDFQPQWTLRTGFMHLQNPTPTRTYGPLGPDEDQEVISLGLGYENEHHTVDIGYAYGIFDGRTVTGSVNSPNGTYDYNVHLLALSYGYKF